jgi:DNA repair protein RadC
MMKKYPIKPELVLLSGVKVNKSEFMIPEIKIRFNRGKHYDKTKITSAADAYPLLKSIAGRMVETQEMGIFLYLNRANNILGYYKHTIGGTAGVPFDIKVIMAGAVKCLAHGIIACHNHPSGNLQPSQADINVTKLMKKAAEVHDINLLDHLIITGDKDSFTSFANDGLMGLSGINGLKGTNMITKTNYFDEIKGVKISSLPEALKEGHQYMVEFKDLIGKDSAIDETIDDYISKLNTWIVKHPDKPKESENKPKVEKQSPENDKKPGKRKGVKGGKKRVYRPKKS